MRMVMLNIWICRAVIVLGWLLIIGGLAVLSTECLLWLRNGTWARMPLRDVVTALPDIRHYDPYDWVVMRGADRVVDWIGSIPTSIVCLVAGFASAWNANAFLERMEARIAARRRLARRA